MKASMFIGTSILAMVAVPAWAQGVADLTVAAVEQDTGTDPQSAVTDAPQAEANTHETEGTAVPDIVVTGIRASLTRALDLKRNAIGVVDAISAEDIGKFPDQNVGESLARIPGVSVTRSGGEGNTVTVRGFGPDFNTVLLNGRVLATDGNARAFDFSILPSQLVSGLEVYKTSEARLQDGGIGSTINMRTARPLDHRGLFVAGQAGGNWDSKTRRAAPSGALIVSNTNAASTFGVLASLVYDRRNARTDRLSTDGWLNANLDFNKDGRVDAANVRVPRTLVQQQINTRRERIGGTLAIDWLPTDQLTIKADGLYSQYKIRDNQNYFGLFNDPGDIVAATVNQNRTVTEFTRGNTGGLANDHIVVNSPRNSKVYAGGVNLEYRADDRTTITTDFSYSGASNDVIGQGGFWVIGARNIGVSPVFHLNEGGLPYMSGIRPSTETTALRAHCCAYSGNKITDDLYQVQLDGKREFDGLLKRISVGGIASNRKKGVFVSNTPDAIVNFYPGYFATVPAGLVSVYDSGSNGFLGSANLPGKWLTYDPAAYVNYLISDAAINQKGTTPEARAAIASFRSLLAQNGGGYAAVAVPSATSAVRERTFGLYAQADFGGDIADMPWKMQLGLRYTHTDLTATGSAQQLTSIYNNPGDPTGFGYSVSAPLPRQVKNSYGYLLPSLTIQLDITDKLRFRFAESRTLTRPSLGQLNVAQSFNIRPPGTFQINSSNPNLKPYLSWNVDAGLDYYFDRVSYVSLAGFYRKIDNFVSQATLPTTVLNFPFLINQPINANTGNAYGLEATVQYGMTFLPAPFDGLGVSANYTMVKSGVTFEPALATSSFNLPGLGDSANASLFYEKGAVQLRAAYNWRAAFLNAAFGAEGQPENRIAYGQLDFTGSVAVTPNVSVFGEVLNALNKRTLTYQLYRERFLNTEETGTRVTMGVRARF